MKNILVLIDLSPRSEQIAQYALKLARQVNANVVLCDALSAPIHKTILFDEDEYWPFEEEYYTTTNALANHLKQNAGYSNNIQIGCIGIDDLNVKRLDKLIAEQNICMIVMGVHDVYELNNSNADDYARQIIDHATCPVLVIPNGAHIERLNRIAYLTDLRYCEVPVVNILKGFDAHIFVTHVSASGIPDMEDSYAQLLLSDEIAAKVKYNKLFLRNIKGTNRKNDLEQVVANAHIDAISIVNKKHRMLDLFIQHDRDKKRAYHQVPLMIIPYMNRHHCY